MSTERRESVNGASLSAAAATATEPTLRPPPSNPQEFRVEIIVTLLCLLLCGLLVTFRVRTTAVSGSLNVSSFHLLLNKRGTIVLDRRVTALQLARVGGLELPESVPMQPHPPIDELTAVFGPGGSATLNEIRAAPGTEIGFQKLPGGRAFTLLVRCARSRCMSSELEFVLSSPSDLLINPSERMLHSGGGRVVATTEGEAMVGQFTAADTAGVLLANQSVGGLSFDLVEQRATEEAVSVSTVQNGKLILEDLSDREVTVRTHERVELRADHLFIRTAELTQAGLKLEFTARVHSVRVGANDALRELKPSLLVWLTTQMTLKTLLTVLVAAVPLALILLRRVSKWRNG